MSGFFLIIFKYVSPVLLAALLIWRFWGKVEWVFLAIIAAIIGYNFIPTVSLSAKSIIGSGENKLKTEIIAYSKMSAEDIKEVMARKKIKRVKGKSGPLIYPADMEGDYRTYYFTPNLRFTISFEAPDDYDKFCGSVDSLIVKGQKMTGCPKDTAYRLASDCFVCKGGFDSERERFVLKISRSLNFEIPKPSQPNKSKPVPPPYPNRFAPYNPYPHLPPIPAYGPNHIPPPPLPNEKPNKAKRITLG